MIWSNQITANGKRTTSKPIRTLLYFKPMKPLEQDIKVLKKKAKSWLAILIYQCAQEEIDLEALNKRFLSLFQSLLKPDILRRTLKNFIPGTINIKEATSLKKILITQFTPNKVYKRMFSYPQIYVHEAPVKDKPDSLTLGRFLIVWAILTNQYPKDFIAKVSSNITRLYAEWTNSTGCSSLSDEECYSHPKESAQFWSGILRIIIQATPEGNLIHSLNSGLNALGAVVDMPTFDREVHGLIDQASHLVTNDATEKIESALNVNPSARERINIPELKALILREETRLGWSNNTENEALKTLVSSLSPELKKTVDDKEEIIRNSMEAVGRRGLLNNLLDALNGQLRPRFVENIMQFLKSIVHVKSYWEFDTSNCTHENAGSIRSWLFRR